MHSGKAFTVDLNIGTFTPFSLHLGVIKASVNPNQHNEGLKREKFGYNNTAPRYLI